MDYSFKVCECSFFGNVCLSLSIGCIYETFCIKQTPNFLSWRHDSEREAKPNNFWFSHMAGIFFSIAQALHLLLLIVSFSEHFFLI